MSDYLFNPPEFSNHLFENPLSDYRGIPFWAWNCNPDAETIEEQIEDFKKMGFGGFIIHSREGLTLPYLKGEFMKCVQTAVKKASEENLKVILYDEDRWPSGSAGGYVTKNPAFRQKFLKFTKKCKADRKPFTTYNIILNENGEYLGYNNDINGDNVWYVYFETAVCEKRYNGFTNVDVLCSQAIDEFINITHEAYKQAVGNEFSKTIPAFFTDEPQIVRKGRLSSPFSQEDVIIPWTEDFADTYFDEYGINIIEFLPELIWELPDGKPSKIRYSYHNHLCDRFINCFCKKCSDWCENNNLMLTGHFHQEGELLSQTHTCGDVMRGYPHFHIPGMDLLCDKIEFNTAKQVQSVVKQYHKPAMLSELYGVTGWAFDFRDHKFQGDWQAALGVSIRVPHLTWMSMQGSAKRDYPASIGSQSPWYEEYSYIENHFARLAAALSRGKDITKIGVIHPIESFWLLWGVEEQTSLAVTRAEEQFKNLTDWLLFNFLDFDFINEALLADAPKNINDMDYSVILVPDCRTLRKSTIAFLEKFIRSGKKVIFIGNRPKYADMQECDSLNFGELIPFTEADIIQSLEYLRCIDIKTDNKRCNDLLCRFKSDNTDLWLFIAHGKKDKNKDNAIPKPIDIILDETYIPELCNTLDGTILPMPYSHKNSKTHIQYNLHSTESLLIHLHKTNDNSLPSTTKTCAVKHGNTGNQLILPDKVNYIMDEPNVLLLDMASFSFRDIVSEETEEILRIDKKCRKISGLAPKGKKDIQPWCDDNLTGKIENVKLSFRIESNCVVPDIKLAFEAAEKIIWNGETVSAKPNGFYVDGAIKTVDLPPVRIGTNTLTASVPFSRRSTLEALYLLGSFGVELTGHTAKLTSLENKIEFNPLHKQKMPFYSANIIYTTEITTPDCIAEITVPVYRGAMIKVLVDNINRGTICLAPYKLTIPLNAGKHSLSLKLFGNRHNTFASLHNCGNDIYYGPLHWMSEGSEWTYDYMLKDFGILKKPQINIKESN